MFEKCLTTIPLLEGLFDTPTFVTVVLMLQLRDNNRTARMVPNWNFWPQHHGDEVTNEALLRMLVTNHYAQKCSVLNAITCDSDHSQPPDRCERRAVHDAGEY